jgi:hypothetical protein
MLLFSNERRESYAMANDWNDRIHEAVDRMEAELRKAIDYVNDEVVPEARMQGAEALRKAAEKLRQVAQKLDERTPRR